MPQPPPARRLPRPLRPRRPRRRSRGRSRGPGAVPRAPPRVGVSGLLRAHGPRDGHLPDAAAPRAAPPVTESTPSPSPSYPALPPSLPHPFPRATPPLRLRLRHAARSSSAGFSARDFAQNPTRVASVASQRHSQRRPGRQQRGARDGGARPAPRGRGPRPARAKVVRAKRLTGSSSTTSSSSPSASAAAAQRHGLDGGGRRLRVGELKAYACRRRLGQVLRATTCDEKVKLARGSARRPAQGQCVGCGVAPWRPPASSKFWAHRRAMTSSIRTHVWYFTLADCSLERYLHPVPAVHYRAEMRDGDSHLPVDENGLRPLHFFNMVTAFILVYAVGKRIALAAAGRAKKGDGDRDVHAAEVLLCAAAAATRSRASSSCATSRPARRVASAPIFRMRSAHGARLRAARGVTCASRRAGRWPRG